MDGAAGVCARVLADMAADPHGQFSPSVYETARLVTLVPGLAGHAGRIRFLLTEQNADGGWGRPDSYGLLPTLSATEALLTESRRTRNPVVGLAAGRGLQALYTRSSGGGTTLPDTVAVEILVPALTAGINAHLDALDAESSPVLRGHRLPDPPGTDSALLSGLRETVRRGHPLPPKVVHSLEAIGPAAQGVPFARAGEDGVGCSPAATAVWLGNPAPAGPARRYLETVQARHDGPVPVAAPLDVFERAWVVATFAGAGIDVPVPAEIVTGLRDAFGESGVPGGAGLPPDADDTATALYALAALGRPRSPDCLWPYQQDDHFVTYPDERTPSVTTNAHVLQAFTSTETTEPRVGKTMRALAAWLCGQQRADGSWTDKWHASPYYATFCSVAALSGCGESTAAVRKAMRWVVATQHRNGSWGRWEGTLEETSYAVRTLLQANGNRPDPTVEQAAARGCAYLLGNDGAADPPLWHDKDLYAPGRIVLAQRIAAVRAANANPRVGRLVGPWISVAAGRTA